MLYGFLVLAEKIFFSFFISSNFWFFTLWVPIAMVYVDIDQGIHKVKTQSCSKWKMKKKITQVFF